MIFAAICGGWSRASRPSYSGRHQGASGDGDAPPWRGLPGMAADDRQTALRCRLADIRRQLRRGVDGALFDTLMVEGAALGAELASAEPQRARRPWKGPGPQR